MKAQTAVAVTADAVREELERRLDAAMNQADPYDQPLWDAMRYSLMAGGKRIRPVLLMLTGLSLGAKAEDLWPFAMGLEMIHTYSLIHDDLPAMDNDDYRRGRLTSHKVFGEAGAILAGDGLLTLAFETMGRGVTEQLDRGQAEKAARGMRCLSYMAQCAGCKGMVAGQIADLKSEGRSIGLEELTYIEFNKTSRLLMAALKGGAYLAGATDEVLEKMEKAGGWVGQAFQIEDDVLDVEGTLEELGKAPMSDDKAQKATFTSLYGLEKAKETAAHLTEEALQELSCLPGEEGEMVRTLVRSLIGRKK